MRSDLNKLICERERSLHDNHYHNYRHNKNFIHSRAEDYEDLPSREGMKKRYVHGWGDSKSFNENLNPLWGYIRKSVGRKWDKVYSEICKTFDKRSVINQHILIHLEQFVRTDLRVSDDGKQVGFLDVSYRNLGWTPLKEAWFEYYVDPRDGILKHNKHHQSYRQFLKKRRIEKQKEEAKIKRVISENIELHKIEDVWYEVNFETVKKEKQKRYDYVKKEYFVVDAYPPKFDVLSKSYVNAGRYAASKTQLSKQQIKKYELNK